VASVVSGGGTELVVVPTFHSFTWLPGLGGEPVNLADPGAALALYRSQFLLVRAAGNVVAGRYLRYMGVQAYEELGRYQECLDLAQELVADADPMCEPLWQATALALSAQASLHGGWHGPALEWLAEAVELLEHHPHVQRDRGLAKMAVAMAMQAAGAYDEADAILRELVRVEPWAEVHFVSELVLLHLTCGAQRRLTGEIDGAAAHFAQAASLALRWRRPAMSHEDHEHVARSLACEAYAMAGLSTVTAAQGVAREIDSEELLAGRLELCMLDLHNGELHKLAGDFDRAREHFRRAFERATRSDAGVWQATALVALAETEVVAHGPHPAVEVWSQLATALLRRLGEQTRSFAAELKARRRARHLGAQNEWMTTQALQDPLTGLANRRALDRALAQATAVGEPVAACFVDVDKFKQINDMFSHAVGDEVLRKVAELTSAACRSTDLIVRYGGDEFVVLTSGDRRSTRPLAERIRSTVSQHPWQRLADGLSVTVSVGLACSLPASAVLASADAALRNAKSAGRNRVAADG